MRLRGTIWLCGLVALLLVGCGLGQERVLLESDGARRWFPIGEAETVAELLRGAQVELGARDRVEPPSYTLLEPE